MQGKGRAGGAGGVAGDRDELVQRGEARGRRGRQWVGRMKGLSRPNG